MENAFHLGCLGVAAEVAFTAVTAPSGGLRLVGHSYLWMFPIYALLGEAPWEPGYRGHRGCVFGRAYLRLNRPG